MKNLYSVTVNADPPLNVVACTENAAIRKALKALFGSVSAAPHPITAAADLVARGVIC